MASDSDLLHADLSELLALAGMSDHARPQSPHEVFQEALGVLQRRLHANSTDLAAAYAQRDQARREAAALDYGQRRPMRPWCPDERGSQEAIAAALYEHDHREPRHLWPPHASPRKVRNYRSRADAVLAVMAGVSLTEVREP